MSKSRRQAGSRAGDRCRRGRRSVRPDSRLVGTLGGLKLLPEILGVDLSIAAKLEDDETDGSLSEDEHVCGVV